MSTKHLGYTDETWSAVKLVHVSKLMAEHLQKTCANPITTAEWVLEEFALTQQRLTNRMNQYRGALVLLRRD